MVQTRSQAKAKANDPTVQSTMGRPGTQNAIPKVDKIPIKTEKDSKPLHSTVVSQQLPQSFVIQPGNIVPLSTHPSVRPPPKPPNAVNKETTSSPNLGQDPNVDFKIRNEKSDGMISASF